ncbi:MAG: M20/M25/M40 family metallo-hydrolase [Candidatus Cyclobacteriaceae bacterium M2_1C_046]
MDLLKKLCGIKAPSGEEYRMKNFLLQYIKQEQKKWKIQPVIHEGSFLQDNIVLAFGNPRTAIFAHMDSVGFTVRYENQLVPIGSPDAQAGYTLVGEDALGPIECKLEVNKQEQLFYQFGRGIIRGTSLTFKPDFREDKDYVQCCYLDNRLGIYNALKVAEELENGIIVFSTFEEHGGGAVPLIMNFIQERYQIKHALISDITWVTDGVHHGSGVVVSMRDRNIPRRPFIDKIMRVAKQHQIDIQLEVESGGSSDGREVHQSPYPVDWCFIGAPEEHVHSPDEKVHKYDIECMIELYKVLMREL